MGYDQKADVWSLGTICYEMLIGRSAFDAEDMEDLVNKIEDGTYVVPTNLSKEVISFINGMLQYESSARLTCEELSKHPFLTKDVKDFQPIDMKKVSKKVDNQGLKINSKMNKSIWAIFNAEDEEKLKDIDGKGQGFAPMLPSNGIPGNPVNQKIQYQQGEEDKDSII